MLPSTQLQIKHDAGPSRLDAIVTDMLGDLSGGHHIASHTKALKAYGGAAVPGLLPALADPALRALALYALQYCWAPQARAPVAALLADPDAHTRHMAALVLAKNEGVAGLARLSAPLLDDARPEIAGFAYERIEAETPDLARTRAFLQTPPLWDHVCKFLPRYHAPELAPQTLTVLNRGGMFAALAAIASLIRQNDGSAATRARLGEVLWDASAEAREFAAEYLSWHGTVAEGVLLRNQLETEEDLYAAAAMRQALAAIERRAAIESGAERSETAPRARDISFGGTDLCLRYRRAAQLLDGTPSAAERRAAFELYRDAEPVEPLYAYDGKPVAPEFVAERESRLALQARLFSMRTAERLFPRAGAEAETEWLADFSGASATSLVPPLRDCFDSGSSSYGNVQEQSDGTFDGMVHVGEDLGWYRDHKTVVAIADGLVRQVSCQWSWGYIVIIEHREASGERLCSLYAHLGPFVCVAPGERVRAGQKIGSIGRSFTWENGGYFAHLHFAIHLGWYWQIYRAGALIDVRFNGKPYLGRVLGSDLRSTQLEIHTPEGARLVQKPTTWVCGYLSKPFWKQKRHGWVDPLKFLRGER